VHFGLLDEYSLACLGQRGLDYNWQRLADPISNVGKIAALTVVPNE